MFQDLMEQLRQQVMQQQFQGMQQALQSMTPDDLRTVRDMLRDLNQMLDEKARGGEPDFQSFMDKWGQFFPGVKSLDELIEQLQQRQAQMQSMLDSMSGEQRRELMQLMQSLVQDPGLRNELAMLAANLEELRPMDDLRRRYPFRGEDSMSFEQAMQVMQDLQEMDRLERQMREAIDTADPNTIDREMLARQLGEQAKEQLDQLDQVTRLLEEAGLVERRAHPSDRRIRLLHLTDKAHPLLDEIFTIGAAMRSEALAGVSEADREQLFAILSAIKANLLNASAGGERRASNG
jgi:uncharacterized protein with von Willebrand factor type A (vWA) domain